MTSAIILLLTFCFEYTISAVLVGLALALLISKKKVHIRSFRAGMAIFFIFVFLEAYSYPAMLSLDMTFTIHNQFVAELLDVGPNAKFTEIVSIGFLDLIIWLAQTAVAICVADAMRIKKIEANLS